VDLLIAAEQCSFLVFSIDGTTSITLACIYAVLYKNISRGLE
jgi:hypothetical protein